MAGIAREEQDGLWADVEGRYEAFFSEHEVSAILVRPDFVVFGAVQTMAELPAMVAELAAVLRVGA
jgi:hypothetical protein